jgi:hypothetical protein
MMSARPATLAGLLSGRAGVWRASSVSRTSMLALDARIITGHVLGRHRADGAVRPRAGTRGNDAIAALVRRHAHEPIAHARL